MPVQHNTAQKVLAILGTIITLVAIGYFFYQLNSPQPAKPEPVQNDSSEKISCGGLANLKCPASYECKYPANPYPDQMGVCE
jgi:hypothetical protein